MQAPLRQFIEFLQQGLSWIFRMLELVWNWSFGAVLKILNSPWQTWSIWKQLILLAAVLGIFYLLFLAGRQLWESGTHLFRAIVGLVSSIVSVLPYIFGAGVLAFVADWVFPRLPI